MCGIVGFVCAEGAEGTDLRALDDALAAIAHRGPDGRGRFDATGVAVGSTRLSIIDVPHGAQPMLNEDGSVVAVYNGEIWNYRDIRSQLMRRGHHFRTRSDTEVLVHGYEEWGDELPEHLDGMFAFAVWDEARQRLLLARDRLGKKPLYLSKSEEGLAFGSDARSLFLMTGTPPAVDLANVAEYLFRRYVISPATLFKGVSRLSPAHRAIYNRRDLVVTRYWSLEVPDVPEPLALDELKTLLSRSVERRLMSEVPIGVLLSGGVDSAGVLALATTATTEPLATFTVGFADAAYDERSAARVTATHYGSDHHELLLEPSMFFAALPRLAWFRDEPIAEASEIPLLLLAEFAGRHVSVVLTGDGGDEVFGGYPKYRADALLRAGGRPAAVALGGALRLLARRQDHRQLDRAARAARIDDQLVRWASWFRSVSPATLGELLSPDLAADVQPGAFASQLSTVLGPYAHLDDGRRMLLADLFTYLPDNMLARSDKLLMAASVEGRMPLLDVDLVARASATSGTERVSVRGAKKMLKAAFGAIVPQEILRLPKRGFPVPVERFVVGEARSQLEQLVLSERALAREIFRADVLRSLVHDTTGRLASRDLFVLASLELWLRANVDRVTTSPPSYDEVLELPTPGALTGRHAVARRVATEDEPSPLEQAKRIPATTQDAGRRGLITT